MNSIEEERNSDIEIGEWGVEKWVREMCQAFWRARTCIILIEGSRNKQLYAKMQESDNEEVRVRELKWEYWMKFWKSYLSSI